MKGDFSRLTFDPKKHYRRVLMQQGRVQVDADWNEQEAINQFRAEIEARSCCSQLVWMDGACHIAEARQLTAAQQLRGMLRG